MSRLSSFRLTLLLGAVLLVPHLLAVGQPYFMDETAVLDNVMTFVGQKTIVPYHTKYPTLYSYLVAPFVLLGAALHWLVGDGGRPAEVAAWLYWERPRGFIVPARLFSVAALAAAAWATSVACVARRPALAARDEDGTAGTLAACGLLATPALVAYGSYGLPDVTCMALSAAALTFSIRALATTTDGRLPRGLVIASVAAGLAVSAKYTAASAFAPVGAAWLVWLVRLPAPRTQRAVVTGAALAAAGIASFLVGSPGWLLAPGRFIAGLRFEMEHAAEGHLGASGVPGLGQLELLATAAPLLALGGLAGLALVASGRTARSRLEALPAAALVAGTLAVTIVSTKQSPHYLVPLLPALAWGLGRVGGAASGRVGRIWLVALTLLVALAAGESFRRGLRAVGTATDVAAGRWIESHLDPASTIAVDMGYVPALYDHERIAFLRGTKIGSVAPGAVDRIERSRTIFDEIEPVRHQRDWLGTTDVDYLVTSEGCSARFFEFGRFTRRRPETGSPLADEFDARRRFYEALFDSPRWKAAHRVPAGNGPSVTVYARVASRDPSPRP